MGKHVLRLSTDITVQPNGSGDTTYNYVQLLCYLVLATVAAIVWSVIDRRRTRYSRLHDFLRIYVRYALAATMLSYGFAKVFKMQFQVLSVGWLVYSMVNSVWKNLSISRGFHWIQEYPFSR